MSTPETTSLSVLASIAGIGAVLSFFQTLASGEKVGWKKAVGRAGVTAGFALAGQSLLVAIPGMSIAASVGVAALLASLGATGLERLATRILGPKDPS